jgi:hypothetical protein
VAPRPLTALLGSARGRPGRAALFDPPETRPVSEADERLDRALLPLMAAGSGTSFKALLRAAERDPAAPDSQVLSWLSNLLHYQLAEAAPENAELWRLTTAGRKRMTEASGTR